MSFAESANLVPNFEGYGANFEGEGGHGKGEEGNADEAVNDQRGEEAATARASSCSQHDMLRSGVEWMLGQSAWTV